MKIFLGLSALAISAAGAVSAQELAYGSLGASYNTFSLDGETTSAFTYGGGLGVRTGAFDMWLNGYQVEGSSSTSGDITLSGSLSEIGLGYTFGGTYRVDISTANVSAGIEYAGLNIGLNEIGFAYDNGTFYGRLGLAVPKQELGIENVISFTGGYAMGDAIDVALTVVKVNDEGSLIDSPIYLLDGSYDGGPWGARLSYLSFSQDSFAASVTTLGGDYAFNGGFGVFGSFSMGNVDLAGNDSTANLATIGVTYDINPNLQAYADYSNISVEDADEDITGFGLGITLSLGDKPASYQTTADRLANALNDTLLGF